MVENGLQKHSTMMAHRATNSDWEGRGEAASSPIYIGETSNEKQRMRHYASYGSHIAKKIEAALRAGKCLYYRAWAVRTKQDALEMPNRMLKRYKYEWNQVGNGDS